MPPVSGIPIRALVAATAMVAAEPLTAADAIPVVVEAVEMGGASKEVELTGTVTAERRSSLSARTAGLIASVNVEEGSRVKKGDVVLELDSALEQLAAERAKESVNEARTQLAESRRLYEEGRKLAETGGLPRTEAQARLAALHTQEAAVKQLEIDFKERAEMLERHKLIAPFSGVISSKMAEVGEWVETGVPVLELVEADRVRFDAQAPQELYADLNGKTSVTVKFDSDPAKSYPAHLRTKVPVKDPVSRTFLVRLDVDAPADVMAPGVSGSATFRVPGEKDVLTVPRDAVVRLPDGSTVTWVVRDADGMKKAASARVRIGDGMGDRVRVLDGLDAGERVVVRGNETLRDGQIITILPAD